MKTVICDLCQQNEAKYSFKVKRAEQIPWDHSRFTRYKRIDICKDCAEKLFAARKNPVPDKKPVQ